MNITSLANPLFLDFKFTSELHKGRECLLNYFCQKLRPRVGELWNYVHSTSLLLGCKENRIFLKWLFTERALFLYISSPGTWHTEKDVCFIWEHRAHRTGPLHNRHDLACVAENLTCYFFPYFIYMHMSFSIPNQMGRMCPFGKTTTWLLPTSFGREACRDSTCPGNILFWNLNHSVSQHGYKDKTPHHSDSSRPGPFWLVGEQVCG